LIISLISESQGYNETSTILPFDEINRSLNSSKGINLDEIHTINDSSLSKIVDSNSGPIKESLVYDDRNYTQEKLLAKNVTLPKNVIEVKPPSNISKVNISNFFINQKNISKIAGLKFNDKCMTEKGVDGNQALDICNPPDIQIAPGRYHVIEMTNNLIGVWNKSALLSNKSIPDELDKNHLLYWTNDFFGVNKANDTYDPSLVYDPTSQRWFASIIEYEIPEGNKSMKLDKMGVMIAFSSPESSSSSDNYKNWTVMKFSPRLTSGKTDYYFCPDRPMIYASNDKVMISMTVSLQEDRFCKPEDKSSRLLFMAVFDKSNLLDDSLSKKDFKVLYLQSSSYHYVPVKSALNESEINVVSIPPYNNNNSRLSLINIDGPLNNLTCKYYDRDLNYPKVLPPNAAQKGTLTQIYLSDNRILDAVSNKNNETWITFHTGCNTDLNLNNTSCIRLVKFKVNKNSLFRDCEEIPFSNSTNPYYRGGNVSTLNNLTTPKILKAISEHVLPLNVTNKVLTSLISDEHTAPKVINKTYSALNDSFSNLTNSEISDKIKNRELPATISNDVLSNLTSDKEIAPKVINETHSIINATGSNLNSSELSKAITEHELPLNVSNKVLSNLTSNKEIAPKIKEKIQSGLKDSVSNLNSSEITEVVINQELPAKISNDVLSNLTSDKEIAPKVVNETRSVLVSNLMLSDVLDFPIGSGDHSYYYPAIAITKNGNLVVYFGFSSINDFPSLGLVVINSSTVSQMGNTINKSSNLQLSLIKNGTHFAKEDTIINDYCPKTDPCTRYGDYLSLNIDPYNSSQLWGAGEYYDQNHFSTVINNIRID